MLDQILVERLLQYPSRYKWANLLNHFIVTRRPLESSFRTGDWLRFLHLDDLQSLSAALGTFNNASPDLHQDLVLLCSLLFSRETEQPRLELQPRLVLDLMRQLFVMAHIERLHRDNLVYIEQRLCIRPGFEPDLKITRAGQAYVTENGALPTARPSF